MTRERIDFLGLPLDLGLSIESICAMTEQKGQPRMVAYISPSSWAEARKHPEYLSALKQMDVVRAGGQGVATACSWLTEKPCPRISFDMTSMAGPFFKKAMRTGATLMLVGGRPGVEEPMQEKLQQNYRDLKIVGTVHGYGDFAPKIALIMEKNPDVVLAGMGTPRQELFLVALREAGYKGMGICCGGFFDQYLESEYYYPKLIDRLNLRFLWRLMKEPTRLWRRYLIDYQIFISKALGAMGRKYFRIGREEFSRVREKLHSRIQEKAKKSG